MLGDHISLGLALLAVLLVAAWIAILVWLAGWLMSRLRESYGWARLDWRTVVIPFVALTATIHLINHVLDWLQANPANPPLGFPSAFLIGSVAIGVGMAAVRAKRP